VARAGWIVCAVAFAILLSALLRLDAVGVPRLLLAALIVLAAVRPAWGLAVLIAAVPVAGTTSRDARRGSETILVVEDNEMVRTLACEILKRHGYTVVEARHGANALDIARRYHGAIHLLLTDVVMPGMGGPELVSRLAPLRPTMKIVYMSGYPADALDHQGLVDGEFEFLPKPIGVEALVRKVREVLDARAGVLLTKTAG